MACAALPEECVCVCVHVFREGRKRIRAGLLAPRLSSPCRAGAPGSVSDRFQELEAMPGVACGSSVGPKTTDLTFTGDEG